MKTLLENDEMALVRRIISLICDHNMSGSGDSLLLKASDEAALIQAAQELERKLT